MGQSPYPEDSLQRLQAVDLEIAAAVDKICRENDIDYFIDGGTLLGAVRHGGFITWDDDIDIGMPKDDFDRFCEIAPALLPKGYSLHTSANTKGFAPLWTKVFKNDTKFIEDVCTEAGYEQGIFVDILPFCRLDANEAVAKKQCRKARAAQVQSYLKHFAHPKIPTDIPAWSLVMFVCRVLHSTIARTWKMENLQARMDHAFDTDNPSKRWTSAVYTNYGVFDENIIFPTKDITFDGLTLRAPHDPDAFLKIEYGDYMQLPPEEKRYTHAPTILDFGDGVNVMKA